MDQDSFRFLRPWHQLLPPAGRAVVGVAGSGACTTVLLRLVELYRQRGARTLVTHTVARPVPFTLRDVRCAPTPDAIESTLDEHGIAYAAGGGDDLADPIDVEILADVTSCDVMLVESGTPSGGRLCTVADSPVWPRRMQLAVTVGNLGLVGRPWGPRAVAGVDDDVIVDGEVRRVSTDDVVEAMRRTIATVPGSARALPFFAGFGAYRDLDGMFSAVEAVLDPPERPVLCFAELLGDARRDAADRRGMEQALGDEWLDDERVYAVYPAALDGPDEGREDESPGASGVN